MAVINESNCLKLPAAQFLGLAKAVSLLANLSLFSNLKSVWLIKTSPLISISPGKYFEFIVFGISLIVLRFSVISSPSMPSPLERPVAKIPFLYVKEAEIPSIFGSVLYSTSVFSFKLKKLSIFFQNFLSLVRWIH